MNHEVRHIATCTCGRTIEVIIRTPGKETRMPGYGKDGIDSCPEDENGASGMLPEPRLRS